MDLALRAEVAKRTAGKLRGAATSGVRSMVGFDGFVDEILSVVETRADSVHFTPVETIARLAQKIAAAAGQSSNYELVVQRVKLGGNGPIMANALAAAGSKVTYIGSVGTPDSPATIHPVFSELARRANVISIAQACHTDAMEFSDGKLMFGKLAGATEVTWNTLVDNVSLDRLVELYDEANLIGCVNWTMYPFETDILRQLQAQVWPKLSNKRRTVFLDLCDPEKRTHEDLSEVLFCLKEFAPSDVILGLNLKEAQQVAGVLGLGPVSDQNEHEAAAGIREKLGLTCVVIHPRASAGCATAAGAWRMPGPFVQHPKISTGAGDHFNAGFVLAYCLGLEPVECLACGVGTSGYYVREAESPSAARLAEFLDDLPAPQA